MSKLSLIAAGVSVILLISAIIFLGSTELPPPEGNVERDIPLDAILTPVEANE